MMRFYSKSMRSTCIGLLLSQSLNCGIVLLWMASCLNVSSVAYAQDAGDDLEDELSDPATSNAPSSNNAQPSKKPASDAVDDDLDGDVAEVSATQKADNEKLVVANSPEIRRFHEVLDELLAEFGYDIKLGQIKGLKNLAIRKVTVNSALPKSYRNYLELIVAERIRENSQIRLIACVSCSNKTSRMIDGKLVITSPTTNMDEMNRAASTLGIDYFMDVVLIYHTTHMVLAFQTFNTETKELVWSRTYNSETIKSRFQKLAVDYSQVKKSRPGDEYVPEFRWLVGMGAANIPNVTDDPNDEGMVLVHFRGTEKFDNRVHEFGMALNLYQSTNSFLSSYPTTETANTGTTDESTTSEQKLKPFTNALSFYMIYAYNFLGLIESYNTTRMAINGGLGTLLTSGYFAGSARIGLDTYFGRSFGLTAAVIYLAESRVLVNDAFRIIPGGAGGEIAFTYNF